MMGRAELFTWIIRFGISIVLYFAARWTSMIIEYLLQFFAMPNWGLNLIRVLYIIAAILITIPLIRWLNKYFKGKGIHLDSFNG